MNATRERTGVHYDVCVQIEKMTHFLAQTAAVLLRDSLGHRHGGYATRLRAADLPPGGVTRLRQVLSDLGGLTRTRFSDYNQDLIIVDGLSRERMNWY